MDESATGSGNGEDWRPADSESPAPADQPENEPLADSVPEPPAEPSDEGAAAWPAPNAPIGTGAAGPDPTAQQPLYGEPPPYGTPPTPGPAGYTQSGYGASSYGYPGGGYAGTGPGTSGPEQQYGTAPQGSWPGPQYAPPAYGTPGYGPTTPVATKSGSGRGAAIGVVALVAALVGALVGGGVAVATRGTKTKTVTQAVPVNSGSPAPPLVSGNQIRDLLGRVEPGVVTILTNTGAGTGMILTPDGEVLTNAHVVEGASTVKVTVFKESEPRTADVVGRGDPTNGPDVALVKIRNATNLPTVTLGDSDKVEVGDDVVAIGNALNLAGGPTVTKGIVSAKDRTLPDAGTTDVYIQTDAAINPGNSGGPLVTGDGAVVGMNTLVIQNAGGNEAAQNLGISIAVNEINPLLDDLRKGVNQSSGSGGAFLGVATETVTPDMKTQLGLGTDSGAIVDDVTGGQAAEAAGLQRGDVIVNFDGKTVSSSSQLRALIRNKKPGDKVSIDFFRGNSKKTATATLGTRPAGG